MTKPRIVLTKPDHLEGDRFHIFWDRLYKTLTTNYANCHIRVFAVGGGLRGAGQVRNFVNSESDSYDLCIAHHLTALLPKTINYKMSYFSNLFQFDTNGYGAFSAHCDQNILEATNLDQNIYDKFYDQYITRCITDTKYSEANANPLAPELPKEFILVPMQVENDTVMTLKKIGTDELIRRALFVGRALKIPLVIKPHPKSPRSAPLNEFIRGLSKRFPGGVYVSTGDIRQLLDRAKAVFVINSGVGFEAMLRFKHVFTYGRCDYQQNTFHNLNAERVLEALAAPIDIARSKRFLYNWWQTITDMNDPQWESKIISAVDDGLVRKWTYNRGPQVPFEPSTI